MKNLLILLLLFSLTSLVNAFADTATNTPVATPIVTGWGPSVVGSVGAFYLKGDYSLLSAGANFGAAYTWDKSANISSIGVYLGPSSTQINGVTTTNINLMTYLDLFKTSAGNFGIGLGTNFWELGKGVKPDLAHTFFALGYHF